MFTVVRLRATSTTNPDTGEPMLSWVTPDTLSSDGWWFAPAGSALTSDGDRTAIIFKPTLYRLGLDLPDIAPRDRLALIGHPNGVPAAWVYDPDDTSRLFEVDGEPGAWLGAIGGWEIPLKRVTG